MQAISLYPHSNRAKYTPYPEAWLACVEAADLWMSAANEVPQGRLKIARRFNAG
jgi:hypothetical protein